MLPSRQRQSIEFDRFADYPRDVNLGIFTSKGDSHEPRGCLSHDWARVGCGREPGPLDPKPCDADWMMMQDSGRDLEGMPHMDQ